MGTQDIADYFPASLSSFLYPCTRVGLNVNAFWGGHEELDRLVPKAFTVAE